MTGAASAPRFEVGDLVERNGVLYHVSKIYDRDDGQILAVSVWYDPSYPHPLEPIVYEDENGEEVVQATASIGWFAAENVHLVRDLDRYYAQVGVARAPLTQEEERDLDEAEKLIRELAGALIERIDSAEQDGGALP